MIYDDITVVTDKNPACTYQYRVSGCGGLIEVRKETDYGDKVEKGDPMYLPVCTAMDLGVALIKMAHEAYKDLMKGEASESEKTK